MNSRQPLAFATCVLGILMSVLSGCAGNPFKASSVQDDRDLGAITQQPAPAANAGGVSAPTFRVTLLPAGGKPIPKDMVFNGSMTVNQAVKKSGAREKFQKVKLTLVRDGENRQRHKLDVKVNEGTGLADPLYDYAIRPGDNVLVHEDLSTPFDKMLKDINPF